MVEPACRSECLVLAKVLDGEFWELDRPFLDEWLEDRFVIVTNENDFFNGRLLESLEVVPNNGMTGDFEQRL